MRKVTASAVILTALVGYGHSRSASNNQWSFEPPTSQNTHANTAKAATAPLKDGFTGLSTDNQPLTNDASSRSITSATTGQPPILSRSTRTAAGNALPASSLSGITFQRGSGSTLTVNTASNQASNNPSTAVEQVRAYLGSNAASTPLPPPTTFSTPSTATLSYGGSEPAYGSLLDASIAADTSTATVVRSDLDIAAFTPAPFIAQSNESVPMGTAILQDLQRSSEQPQVSSLPSETTATEGIPEAVSTAAERPASQQPTLERLYQTMPPDRETSPLVAAAATPAPSPTPLSAIQPTTTQPVTQQPTVQPAITAPTELQSPAEPSLAEPSLAEPSLTEKMEEVSSPLLESLRESTTTPVIYVPIAEPTPADSASMMIQSALTQLRADIAEQVASEQLSTEEYEPSHLARGTSTAENTAQGLDIPQGLDIQRVNLQTVDINANQPRQSARDEIAHSHRIIQKLSEKRLSGRHRQIIIWQ
ncbi:MAG: hypothetical protein HC800_08455 [Phormidesmis sp. RL_2_1]|nr:hypothetical protein [Phormidesmis sp. RL_2_1]